MSNSPWFWEKMHRAADQHAQLKLDYNIPNSMRAPLADSQTGRHLDHGGARNTQERYPDVARSNLQASRPKAAVPEPVVDARRSEASVPACSRAQAVRVPSGKPEEGSQLGKSIMGLKNLQGSSAQPRKQTSTLASLEEARALLSKLLQPESEDASLSQGLPVATGSTSVGSPIAATERPKLDRPISASHMGRQRQKMERPTSASHMDRQKWDGLKTAMNRMQSDSEVRQLLASSSGGKACKDSFSGASTQTGSTATSLGGSPRFSRQPSKELSYRAPRYCA